MLRTIRKVQLVLGPAVFAALLILVGLFAVTVVSIYVAERGATAHSTTVRASLNWVALKLVADAPWSAQTAGGHVVEYAVDLLKPISIAVITAALTSHLFQMIVRRGSGMGRTRVKNHIVVCGWSSKGNEIVHEIRGRRDDAADTAIVVLAPLDSNPSRDEMTTFISGDPAEAADLRRAGIERASAAVVLADNSYPDIDAEEMDSKTLLATLAIESLNPSCYTIVEVVHSANREHFSRTKADELVVSAHLTGALLAHSAVARGLSRVVDDLLTYPEGDEFYWVDVPPTWHGTKFYEAMSMLKLKYDCLPLAVSREGDYTTNPHADHVLEKGDRVLVISKEEPAIV